MTRLFRRWPIWIKLVLAFVIAVLIPTLVSLIFVQIEIQAVDLRNLETYIIEQGHNRQEHVTEIFDTASTELDTFVNNLVRRGLLITAIRREAPPERIESAVQDLNGYIDSQLVTLNVFSTVRVLDLQGEVVLSSGELLSDGRVSTYEIGEDQSASLAYQNGLSLLELGKTQQLVAGQQDGETFVEVVQVVGRGDSALGFVVGTVDIQGAITPLLSDADTFVETNSYLVTDDVQLIIASDEYREQATRSAQVSPVGAAISQESGIDLYETENQRLIGYYSGILETPFALITEADANTSFTLTLIDIYNRAGIVLLVMAGVGVVLALVVNSTITPALQTLISDIQALNSGDFTRPVRTASRQDEIGDVARAFVNVRDQVQSLITELEGRVNARVSDLEATQAVSRFAATQRDLQMLMDRVVALIVERFPNIYHAQVFLLDDDRRNAVLRASTGSAGRQLLQRGHRLEVGGVSVIGQVTEEGRVVVARDTAASGIHRRNEFLPETRAELAIPLRISGTIIGALDVQSKQSDSFTPEQVDILQTMADQIAIAIANARLYEESMRRLGELELSNQENTRRAWQDHMSQRRQRSLVHEAGTPTPTATDALWAQVLQSGETAIGAPTERDTIPFVIPIRLRNETIGAVEWELPTQTFTRDKVMLAQELVNRLAVSLDNARLFQASRQATDRERLVNEISALLTQKTDVDAILQTAVREVGKALRVPVVDIELNWAQQQNGSNGQVNPSTEAVAEDKI